MQRAGLTRGGFYAHFENRDDLIAKAFDRMRADSQEMLRRNLDTQSAADGIDRLIDDYLTDRMMHRIEASCSLPMPGHEARRLPPAARSVLSATIANFSRRLVPPPPELGRLAPSHPTAIVHRSPQRARYH